MTVINSVDSCLGVDLGGTKLGVAVVDSEGGILAATSQPHNATLSDIVGRLEATIDELRCAGHVFERVGLGVPGAVDPQGRVHLCPAIPDLNGVDVAALLQLRLGIEVVAENDANAAAVGEYRFGGHRVADAPVADLASVCLGTGIGLGIISGGRLLRGARGAAGEIAELRLDHSTDRSVRVEDVAQATSLARAAGELHRSAMPRVLANFVAGEPRAVTAVRRYCEVTAQAIAATCVLVDPALVVLSGGLGSQPVMVSEVAAAVQRLIPTLTVVRSPFGESAPVIGAAAIGVPADDNVLVDS